MLLVTADVPDFKFDGKMVKCAPKDVDKYLSEAEYILCTVTTNLKDLRKAKHLKLISTISVGVDHIDVEYCKQNNIKIGYTPDVLTDAVADVTIGLILMTMRKLLYASRLVMKDKPFHDFSLFNEVVGVDIKHKTIGIIGLGRIGYNIAKRLSAFNVNKILYHGLSGPKPYDDFQFGEKTISLIYISELTDLVQKSDVVIMSCALNESTRKMADSDFFSQMKSTAFFFNIARGQLVDTNALVDALRSNKIAGAGLDVVDPEPIPVDHPLLKMDNVVVLPHIASAGKETRMGMFNLALKNMNQFKLNNTLCTEYIKQ